MKNKNLSWVGALFVFALLLWCTAVTPGKVADPATYTCAVYSTFFFPAAACHCHRAGAEHQGGVHLAAGGHCLRCAAVCQRQP